MASNTNAGQRNGHNYFLVICADDGAREHQEYRTLEALAVAAFFARCAAEQARADTFAACRYRVSSDGWVRASILAYSTRGRLLDVVLLSAWGARLSRTSSHDWWGRPLPGYVRRCGPVPGIGKLRGGPSSTHCSSFSERRRNSFFLAEEGEPECRASRRPNHLYNSWDGRPRCVQRCWKSQHKGRKAWDR